MTGENNRAMAPSGDALKIVARSGFVKAYAMASDPVMTEPCPSRVTQGSRNPTRAISDTADLIMV